ncbi:MAG: hypothetical protein EXS25_00240 [Pedosphaera sp.]|nr:hypothetical protein [Pedosphaera sp.]
MNPLHITQTSGHRLRLAWLMVVQLVGLFTVLRVSLAVFFPSPLPVSLIDWVHCFAIGFHFDLAVSIL